MDAFSELQPGMEGCEYSWTDDGAAGDLSTYDLVATPQSVTCTLRASASQNHRVEVLYDGAAITVDCNGTTSLHSSGTRQLACAIPNEKWTYVPSPDAAPEVNITATMYAEDGETVV